MRFSLSFHCASLRPGCLNTGDGGRQGLEQGLGQGLGQGSWWWWLSQWALWIRNSVGVEAAGWDDVEQSAGLLSRLLKTMQLDVVVRVDEGEDGVDGLTSVFPWMVALELVGDIQGSGEGGQHWDGSQEFFCVGEVLPEVHLDQHLDHSLVAWRMVREDEAVLRSCWRRAAFVHVAG